MSWWILVNSSRTVKLADFGMTRAMFESDYYRFSRKGESSTKNRLEKEYVKRAHACVHVNKLGKIWKIKHLLKTVGFSNLLEL